MTRPLHRNSQKRYYEDAAVYFITTITHNRHPFFNEPILANLFIRNLWFAKKLKQFELYGYTILPDHVHLLIQPSEKANYSEVMHNIKRVFSLQANQIMFSSPYTNPIVGEDIYPRLRKNDRYASLGWSKTLTRLHKRFIKQHGTNHDFPKFKWQPSFRDHVIRDERDYLNHLEYIHGNAIKHGLVANAEDWLYMWVVGMREPVFSESP